MLPSPTDDLFKLYPEISTQLYSSNQIINIDYTSILYNHDQEYADRILVEPTLIDDLSGTASRLADNHKRVCIINLPYTKPIHKLRSEDNYNLIQIEGTVILRTGVLSRPKTLVYSCPACPAEISVEQTEQWLITPEKCTNCDNRKGFKKCYEKTTFDDYQWIQVQELNENTQNSSAPSKIKVLLRNSHVESCEVGDIIKLTGVPKVLESSSTSKTLEMKTYIDSTGIVNNRDESRGAVTEDRIQQFHELAEREDFLDLMINSTASTLYGLNEEKLFLDLQQVGGVEKMVYGEYKRGSIHGWFPGDPSEGKSVMLDWATRMSQRGMSVGGGGASGVGLTASVRHDKDLSEWVLDPGALVLADNGHVSIDEIEKMRDEDRNAIHPAMEQQRITINKAGINANLLTRASVLGASNPKNGKWNKYMSIGANIDNLPPALHTRFDCIFLFINDREWEDEEKRAEHVINIHSENIGDSDSELLDEKTMKQYFMYARTFKPKLTKKVTGRLKQVYKTLFDAGKAQEEETTMITLRQLEGLIRLTEASAKLHLRDVAIVEDAEVALRVLKASLFKTAFNEEKQVIDMSSFYKDTGKPRSKQDKILIVENMIKGYVEINNCKGIDEDALYVLLHKKGLKLFESQSLLIDMERNQFIYRDGNTICLM